MSKEKDDARKDLARRLAAAFIGWHLSIGDEAACDLVAGRPPSGFWLGVADLCVEHARGVADRMGVECPPASSPRYPTRIM